MQRLKDRVSIITGAAAGIGEGIARAMAREGANVVLFGRHDTVKKTAKDISDLGQKAVAFRVDVASVSEVNGAVQQVLRRFGKVDILVNNAGIYPEMLFVEMPDDVRDRVIDVNIKGVWNCTKAVILGMIKQKYGKIINVSSVTGPMVAAKGETIYSASKGAVSGFTRALALEVAEHGINVNAICPGYIDTPGMRNSAGGMDPDEYIGKLAEGVPLGRLGSTDEVGDLAVFLASEESKYITGAEIVIDGGNIIQEQKEY